MVNLKISPKHTHGVLLQNQLEKHRRQILWAAVLVLLLTLMSLQTYDDIISDMLELFLIQDFSCAVKHTQVYSCCVKERL